MIDDYYGPMNQKLRKALGAMPPSVQAFWANRDPEGYQMFKDGINEVLAEESAYRNMVRRMEIDAQAEAAQERELSLERTADDIAEDIALELAAVREDVDALLSLQRKEA